MKCNDNDNNNDSDYSDYNKIENVRNEYEIICDNIKILSDEIEYITNKINNETLSLCIDNLGICPNIYNTYIDIQFETFDKKEKYIKQENEIIEQIYNITTLKINLLKINNEIKKLIVKKQKISEKYGNSLFEEK
jgi:hypothetical protein